MRSTILDALRDAGTAMTVTELSADCGIPATTIRFHLRALADDGLVTAETAEQTGRGRPRLLYRARRAMDPSGPRNYELLAGVLVRALAKLPGAEQQAAEAGRAWGREQADTQTDPVDDVILVLDEFGFAPQKSCGGVRLNRCPFLELARERPGITCAVHRGIMQGVLSMHSTGVTLAGLDPFVDDDHCYASLTEGDHQ
ncbi:helix-turn-helix transcriptional regulator [Gordonia hydrophobica]|uniref:ArsR family transcriptional regulator n=1 Tax=Gordonia hydrophobica TaxID=40516 RepID=A0ABZ2U3M1_9ACTN|nr:helix-turn-helix domain-containing protein [Gordonia hydrophobica]MBM7367888.1 putative ArsR family transcriptional regulator [Gordonia hydrophobica]